MFSRVLQDSRAAMAQEVREVVHAEAVAEWERRSMAMDIEYQKSKAEAAVEKADIKREAEIAYAELHRKREAEEFAARRAAESCNTLMGEMQVMEMKARHNIGELRSEVRVAGQEASNIKSESDQKLQEQARAASRVRGKAGARGEDRVFRGSGPYHGLGTSGSTRPGINEPASIHISEDSG